LKAYCNNNRDIRNQFLQPGTRRANSYVELATQQEGRGEHTALSKKDSDVRFLVHIVVLFYFSGTEKSDRKKDEMETKDEKQQKDCQLKGTEV
jgi:hypothetical protein